MRALLGYLVRRLAAAVLLVFVVSSGALLLARVAPGDFASDLIGEGVTPETLARARARYGLDQPVAQQYLQWVSRAVRLDLGTSFAYGRPVGGLVAERAANTALLAAAALLLATLVGIPLGVIAGSRPSGMAPSAIRLASMVGLSLPPLILSLLLALMAARTGWFPVGGMISVGAAGAGWAGWMRDLGWHLALPALALALPLGATLERLQAQAMADAMAEPYIVSAIGRGVPRGRVVWWHALRSALRPVLSIYGLMVGGLLSGSFAVEIVTAWPGLGRLMYEALVTRDIYLVTGCAAAGAVFLGVGNLMSDLALAAVDPRLREPAS